MGADSRGFCITGYGGFRARRGRASGAAACAELPFGITDFGGDLVNAGLGGLEQVHGVRYPQFLEVGERRFAKHAGKPGRGPGISALQRSTRRWPCQVALDPEPLQVPS